jgi:type IV pilus assembly protein PilA
MTIRPRGHAGTSERGFTLVEVLVVIIVLGVLAAIAVPTFLGQRRRGWEAAAQSDLKNLVIAVESMGIGHDGSYAAADGLDAADTAATLRPLTTEGFHQTDGVDWSIMADDHAFCVTANHTNGGSFFRFHSSDEQLRTFDAAPELCALD